MPYKDPAAYRLWYQKNKERLVKAAKGWQAAHPGYMKRWLEAKRRSRPPWPDLELLKKRARRKKLAFDLNDAWAAFRWTGYCELTGIPFEISNTRGTHPYAASVDRIDPTKGYLRSNCRYILFAVNAFKSTMTDAEVKKIAAALVGS